MDFASIWVILKAKSCWATISEYIRDPNMKLNEYGISEYAKNPDPLYALAKRDTLDGQTAMLEQMINANYGNGKMCRCGRRCLR